MVTTNATPCCTPGTSSTQVSSMITITGLGDHDRPDWLITMTGIRRWCRAAWRSVRGARHLSGLEGRFTSAADLVIALEAAQRQGRIKEVMHRPVAMYEETADH